jgi:steroid delta-isomerase-like uncharacterized protein
MQNAIANVTPQADHAYQEKGLIRARGVPVAGERLRALRQARHWSQRRAAERAGVSDRLIRRAENGGPLEQKSLDLLAQLYSTREMPLTADDLVGVRPWPRAEEAAWNHETLLRRWFDEVWNQGRLAAIDELAAADCLLHADGIAFCGPAAIRKRAEAIRAGFNNFHVEIEQVTTQHDLVIARWRMSMTNRGVWMGLPPTKKHFFVYGSTWMRIRNGQISERWDCWDMRQVTDAVRNGQPVAAAHRKRRRARKR